MDTKIRKKKLSKVKKLVEGTFLHWEKENSLEEARKFLTNWIEEPSDKNLVRVFGDLGMCAWQYMAHATYDIVFKQAGTEQLKYIWMSHLCALGMWQAELADDLRLDKHYQTTVLEFNTVLHNFSLSVIFDEKDWMHAFITAMYGYQEKGAFLKAVCTDLPYATFIHTIANRILGVDIESQTDTVYDKVLLVLDKHPERLPETIEFLLDYQLDAATNAKGISDDHERYYEGICFSSAFAFQEVMLLPSHVMLVHKYCLLYNIPFPVIEHPLYPKVFSDLVEGAFEKSEVDGLVARVTKQIFLLKKNMEKEYPERIYHPSGIRKNREIIEER